MAIERTPAADAEHGMASDDGAAHSSPSAPDTQDAQGAQGERDDQHAQGERPASLGATLSMDRAFLEGRRGLVYGPLTMRSDARVVVFVGARGSGLTSLMLSLSGRMMPGSGHVAVLDHDVAADGGAVRSLVGIVGVDAVDGLDASATVGSLLRRRWSWAHPWWVRRPRADDAWVNGMLGDLFGPVRVPDAAALVADLDEDQRMLLRIALALVDDPRALAIDAIDAIAGPKARLAVMGRLAWLADRGFVVFMTTHDPRDVEMLYEAGAAGVRAYDIADGKEIR